MQEINQVTLLVLALFFIVQLVIYSFCLIKLKEIGEQKLSAELKLKLLENEENLFDFGLYVGLGGTLLSFLSPSASSKPALWQPTLPPSSASSSLLSLR